MQLRLGIAIVALGAVLAGSGCKALLKAGDGAAGAGKSMAKQGAEVTQQAGEQIAKHTEEAGEMAKRAGEHASEAVGSAAELASVAFDQTTQVTEDTAGSAVEQIQKAVDSLRVQYDKVKANLDPSKNEELTQKFDSIRTQMTALKDKTGMELVTAVNQLKTEGSELANEISALGGTEAESETAATPNPSAAPQQEPNEGI